MRDEQKNRGNRLLSAMPGRAFAELQPRLETVSLARRKILKESGEVFRYVYFPHDAIVCLMATLEQGAAETATIGSEGFVGFEVVLGGKVAANRAVVQLPGTASRIGVSDLREVMAAHAGVRDLLLRYVRFFLLQALQSVACNGLHTVEERCAKWLLLARDRAGGVDTLMLTQELLADMLGVHRPSVTIVARTLQNAGLIRYSRGLITITDAKGLEEASCECYRVVRSALEETLPSTRRKSLEAP